MREPFAGTLAIATWLSIISTGLGQVSEIGFQAELSDRATGDVSGTIEIVGPTTLRFIDFNYNGTGGGLVDLALLIDRGNETLRNNNIGGIDNGSRSEIINGVLTPVGGLGLDPLNPPAGVAVPSVEFDQAFRVASIRGNDPDPGVDPVAFPGFSPSTPGGGDSPPFVNFNGDLDLSQISGSGINGDSFGDNGESLTDFAGFSVFNVPFGLDFGSGIFVDPNAIPEPTAISLALLSSGLLLGQRRRSIA